MKCLRCHLPLLAVLCLGFWVAGSGCAQYDSFVADFSGGSQGPQYAAAAAPQPQHVAAASQGNWLDRLLPSQPPAPCPNCQRGPDGPMGAGLDGLVYQAPPVPQNIPARLHPVPTHPMFSSQFPASVAASERLGSPGHAGTVPTRGGVMVDPSPRTARVNPAPKTGPIPTEIPPSDPAPAIDVEPTKENADAKSDVQRISAIGGREKPTAAPSTPSPLQLNAPANAEPIAPSPAAALSAPNPPAAKTNASEGWHPVLRGGYTSR